MPASAAAAPMLPGLSPIRGRVIDPLFKLAVDRLPEHADLRSQSTVSRTENLAGRTPYSRQVSSTASARHRQA
jgi:hypothetical protein